MSPKGTVSISSVIKNHCYFAYEPNGNIFAQKKKEKDKNKNQSKSKIDYVNMQCRRECLISDSAQQKQ